MLKMGLTFSLSTECKTYTLLTSVHNDTDKADTTDDADDYNRVICHMISIPYKVLGTIRVM